MKRLTAQASPRFFPDAGALRKWFAANHAAAAELWIGFYRKGSGQPSITYPEALDEALCVGWIDGVRKRIDDRSYVQRFTPRRKRSIWSAVNIRKVAVLQKAGRMKAAGLAAFRSRDERRSNLYSYEQSAAAFTPAQQRRFKSDPDAWAFFERQPPGYRRLMTWWVTSARQDDTRDRRLARLIESSHQGKRLQ
jgi:uncharacterized protein YdeI (YjbR/CyaY-like superfamily)